MLIRDLLVYAYESLGAKESAILDSELLLAYALGESREYLTAHSGDELENEAVLSLFRAYLKRVVDGEPVAYILGEKEFYGLDFFVDNRVLLPRPETELIVEKVLEYFRSDELAGVSSFRLLDVGTGSGNIVVSIAKTALDVFVDADAVDISDDALEVARLNAQQHCVEDRVSFFNSDLLENIDDAEKYDVIVANLPYIGEVDNSFVEENVEKYEPSLALFGGDDGLELYKKMFQQVLDKGVSFDLMIGEFGFGQSEEVSLLLNKYFDHRSCSIEKDLAGIDRIFVIK